MYAMLATLNLDIVELRREIAAQMRLIADSEETDPALKREVTDLFALERSLRLLNGLRQSLLCILSKHYPNTLVVVQQHAQDRTLD
jgi:hypothetical protein